MLEKKIIIVLMNIALSLIGNILFSGFCVIIRHYDPNFKNDSFVISVFGYSWASYCILNVWLKFKNLK